MRSLTLSPGRLHLRPAFALGLLLAVGAFAADKAYEPADLIAKLAPTSTEILPERFLRGYDPITITYPDNASAGRGPADDATGVARLVPSWPGAWSWLDRKTLQFRPAEPWPALQRFAVESRGENRVLSTMMTAPTAMQPANGTTGLPPFRTLTVTFPQALPLDALRKMIRLEVRELPGLADSSRRRIESFDVALLPRADQRSPAQYAITFADEVGEGRQLVVGVSLALGDEGTTLWTGRASTRLPFHLEELVCGGNHLQLAGAPRAARESALDCGSAGEAPELVFSAPPSSLSLTSLKRMVRLEPSVPDLRASVSGRHVQLQGRFVPDTLYRIQIAGSDVVDDLNRPLQDPGAPEAFFFLGWKKPFLRVTRGDVIAEQKGPRMLPLSGYGEARADVRVHRIDPLHKGLWPFPDTPLVVREEQAPPFPGEEPAIPDVAGTVGSDDLERHLRLLGAPIISRVFDLPLANHGGTTTFGLDVGKALDDVVGRQRPGTYLIGVRRLTGAPERVWTRMQVTNLSLTTVEERGQAVFFVRALDTAGAVEGAHVTLEATHDDDDQLERVVLTTDAQGRATLVARPKWNRIVRIVVDKGDDVLVLDPRTPPSRFMFNHWSSGSAWLALLGDEPAAPRNDQELGFVFTERPIYRPGEKVFVKGWARDKRGGLLVMPRGDGKTTPTYVLKVTGPGGQEWVLPTTTTPQFGVDGVFEDKDAPTGMFTAALFRSGSSTAIAQRTFKIEAYRLPTFEVQLTSPSVARLDGAFKVKALARYYAGGNVANEAIKWTVTRRPHYYVPKGRDGWLFASSTQFARPDARPRDESIEKSDTLDDGGASSIEINPALDIDGSPRIYRFEATVTGADDQQVSAVTEVAALPPFVLGMKLSRYEKTATSVDPQIVAVGPDDKNAAGQKVTVRLYKRSWHSHLRESQFATGEANWVTEQEDTRLQEIELTTTTEPLTAKLPVKEAGVYVVELLARDKLGRMQTLSADLYIGGKEPVAWQKGRAGVFELVPDKTTYKPGETANVVIKSPFTTAKALCIVEEPAGNRYSFVDIDNGAGALVVPVSREHTPNLPIHVVVMRGRLGDSSNDDAPYRPQSAAGSVDLEVEPVKNEVNVELKHAEQARPGTTLDVTLNLKDDRGAPVPGEVTLWLVDEAVLALAKEGTLNPLEAFIVRNARDANVFDTRNSVVGRVLEDEAPGGDGAEDEAASGMVRRRVRKNFQTVPYWAATLQVPASGTLKVPVPLSDDLTNFKVRAVAVSGAERFGHVEDRLKVRLPILIQPQLPRFVRQGDRFDGGGVARLVEGAEGAGVVKAEFSGPVVERKRSKDIALTQSKAASVTFPVEVQAWTSDAPMTVKMEVLRKSDGVGDAFEVKIPILPDRPWETSSSFEDIADTERALKGPAEAPRAGTATYSIVATHVPGLLETFAALEYLDAYPHGCLEQKMSQLAPPLALSTISGRLGGFEFAGGVKAQVTRLVAEMPQYQADNGLFGFWPGSPGSVQLTADVLEFLAQADKLRVPIDGNMKARAQDALRSVLRSDYGSVLDGWRANMQSAALRGLTRTGNLDEHYLTDLMRTRKPLDLTSRAELALAMLGRQKTFASDLDTLKGELWSNVTFNLVDGKRTFVGLADPRRDWGGAWLGSPTSSIATVMEALLALDPKNNDHELLMRGLLARGGTTRGWGSTYDNRRAVSAIVAYLDKADVGTPETKLVVAGKPFTLDAAAKVARFAGGSDVAVKGRASGAPVHARVRWRYLPATPGDRAAATKAGFLVQRAMTIYPLDDSAPARLDDVRGAERTMQVGQIAELHARVTVDRAASNVAFVVPFAAGLEPLNPALLTSSSDAKPSESDSITPTYVQRLDSEVRYYFDALPAGTHAFHFRVKALTPGSYVHPGAYAEKMYDEAVRGSSDGMRLIVTPGTGTPDEE